jgi:glycosidase
MEKEILENLTFNYGPAISRQLYDRLMKLVEDYRKKIKIPDTAQMELTENDSILITYGDQILMQGEAPLKTLRTFLIKHIGHSISGIHILPFFPYSSDDGFSVIDYKQVNPDMGCWHDILELKSNYKLMFDLVLNHISSRSMWFKRFLSSDPHYLDYFIVVDKNTDLSSVKRPRTLPLLTPVQTKDGEKHVWTTFSPDQIDLNFKNPDIFIEMMDTLLYYVWKGAWIIRLDAIGYLWKEPGTTCLHLQQTHRIVRLMRQVLNLCAPWVIIITETNVPHEENISYFGENANEAQMVYQFSLPPLVLHSITKQSSKAITKWASSLSAVTSRGTFFNFLASHDGIGVLPVKGLLSEKEIQALVDLTKRKQGFVSYKTIPQGEIPYELNISYLDAVTEPDDDTMVKVKKYLTSQAIMLSLAGVPGIYIHSLLGSRNFLEGVKTTGMKRTINRMKFKYEELEKELQNKGSLRAKILSAYLKLLKARSSSQAFNPFSGQSILNLDERIFACLRGTKAKNNPVLCIHNVSGDNIPLEIPEKIEAFPVDKKIKNIITNRDIELTPLTPGKFKLQVSSYETIWLKLRG